MEVVCSCFIVAIVCVEYSFNNQLVTNHHIIKLKQPRVDLNNNTSKYPPSNVDLLIMSSLTVEFIILFILTTVN